MNGSSGIETESTDVINILRKDSTGLSHWVFEDKGDKKIEADSKALNQYGRLAVPLMEQ